MKLVGSVSGYRWEKLSDNQEVGTESNSTVAVMREFKNSEANHLGMPLRKGGFAFTKRTISSSNTARSDRSHAPG